MPRVASDDEGVASIRVSLARSGGTRRPCVRIPADDGLTKRVESGSCESLSLTSEDVVRVVIDREERYAPIAADGDGRLIRGAFDNRRLARETGEGTNRLVEWLAEHGREPGESIVLDVVVPGAQYGLRIPGERTVYEVNRGPRSSLADIARTLDG